MYLFTCFMGLIPSTADLTTTYYKRNIMKSDICKSGRVTTFNHHFLTSLCADITIFFKKCNKKTAELQTYNYPPKFFQNISRKPNKLIYRTQTAKISNSFG